MLRHSRPLSEKCPPKQIKIGFIIEDKMVDALGGLVCEFLFSSHTTLSKTTSTSLHKNPFWFLLPYFMFAFHMIWQRLGFRRSPCFSAFVFLVKTLAFVLCYINLKTICFCEKSRFVFLFSTLPSLLSFVKSIVIDHHL